MRGDTLWFAAPRGPRRAGQPFGLAFRGGGYAVYVQPAGVRAALAGDLHELVGPGGGGLVAVHGGGGAGPRYVRPLPGGEEREAPVRDIYAVYGNPLWGVLALVVLYGLLVSLAALLMAALRALSARRARV